MLHIATKKGFMDGRIIQKGEKVEYEGDPCSWLKPIEEDKPKLGRPSKSE